jgi:TPR repeat protein
MREQTVHSSIYNIDMAAAIEDVVLNRVERLVLPTIAELKNKAARQNACAAFFLYLRLKKSNPDEAHHWCIKAAKLGHLEAQKNLSLRGASPTEKAHWLIAMAARTEDDERIDRARYDLARAWY